MMDLRAPFEAFFLNTAEQQAQVWKELRRHGGAPWITHKSFASDRLLIALYMLTGGTKREKRSALDIISDVQAEARSVPLSTSSFFIRKMLAGLNMDLLHRYPAEQGEVLQLAILIDKMRNLHCENTFDYGATMMKRRMLGPNADAANDIGDLNGLPRDVIRLVAEKI